MEQIEVHFPDAESI